MVDGARRAGGTPYLRLARECPEHAGWRMPVGLVVAVAAYFTLSTVLLGYALVALASSEADVDRFIDSLDLDTSNIWLTGLAFLLVAFMLPAMMLGRFVGGPRPGDLWSVEGRIRWRWLGWCSALALVVYGVVIVVAIALSGGTGPDVDADAVIAIAVVLAVVPFQATAEEVVFRGHLMQMVGTWTRWAWVPVVVSTPLFVAGHTYDALGLVDVGIFGLTAAVLVVRTGGLEAAMAAHAANNVVLLVIDSVGVRSDSLTDPGVVDLLPTVLTSALMLGGVEVLFRRQGLRRTRPRLPDPPSRVPVAGFPPAWPVPGGPEAPGPATGAPAPARVPPPYPGEISPHWPYA